MNKKTLWWIVGGSILLLITLIVVGKMSSGDGTKVSVEKVAQHTIKETVTASGKIYPETEVKISPEVSGEIIELTVDEGDSVRKGELLVRINPAIYQSMVSQAQAAVAESRARVANSRELATQAKANYDQARAHYQRNKQLYENKVISVMEFEQSESEYLSAKAGYEASQANVRGGQFGVQASLANLDQAQENLKKTIITAPTSGIISELNVKKGERVVGTAQMAGTVMLTIADLGRIEVRVDVSETDIAKVKMGDTAFIEADAYRGRQFTGVVSKISVSSNSTAQINTDQITNYTVHILILSSSYADLIQHPGRFPFKPGMSASVEIQTKVASNVLAVPVNAVTTRDYPDSVKKETKGIEDLRQVVFVYDETTRTVQVRDVKTGIQDNQYILIQEGLKAEEKVVIAPYSAIARQLDNGDKVQIVEKGLLFDTKE